MHAGSLYFAVHATASDIYGLQRGALAECYFAAPGRLFSAFASGGHILPHPEPGHPARCRETIRTHPRWVTATRSCLLIGISLAEEQFGDDVALNYRTRATEMLAQAGRAERPELRLYYLEMAHSWRLLAERLGNSGDTIHNSSRPF